MTEVAWLLGSAMIAVGGSHAQTADAMLCRVSDAKQLEVQMKIHLSLIHI